MRPRSSVILATCLAVCSVAAMGSEPASRASGNRSRAEFEKSLESFISNSNVRYNLAARVHELSTSSIHINQLNQPFQIKWGASLSQHPSGNPVWNSTTPERFYGSTESDVHVTSHVRLFLDVSQFQATDKFEFVVLRTERDSSNTVTLDRTVLPASGVSTSGVLGSTETVGGGQVYELLIADSFSLDVNKRFEYRFKMISAKWADGTDIDLTEGVQVTLLPTYDSRDCYATVGMFELVNLVPVTQSEAIPLSALPK